jgi:hypothetical protein
MSLKNLSPIIFKQHHVFALQNERSTGPRNILSQKSPHVRAF